MPTITTQETLAAIIKLSEDEKKVLADFERRITSLYLHKKYTGKVIRLLDSFKDLLKDKKSSAKWKILVKKNTKQLMGSLKSFDSLLRTSFHSFQLPPGLTELSDKERAILQQDLEKNMKEYKMIYSLSPKAVKQVADNLRQVLALEETEQNLLEHFQKKIQTFSNFFHAQKASIERQLALIQQIHSAIKQSPWDITLTSIDGWIFILEKHRQELRSFIKEEKELIQEPIEVVKKTKRVSRLVKRAIKHDKITQQMVAQDIQTFSTVEEFQKYQALLLRHKKLLTSRAETLLLRGGLESAKASTKQRFSSRYLKRIALYDKLTGLQNRYHLGNKINEINSLLARGKLESYSVILIDIDHFKIFNDFYGHDVGDFVLKLVAKWVKESIRDTDTAVRWGGEEILVVTLHYFGENELVSTVVAERIRENIENNSIVEMKSINNTYSSKKQVDRITVSIGVAKHSEKEHFNELLTLADARLYEAKKKGRNRVVVANNLTHSKK